MVNHNDSEEISIERYEVPKVDVYKITGELVGTFNNEHEFNKFRIQMLKKNMTNKYFFMWGEIRITVNVNGDMDKFPVGLYDQVQRDLAEMFRIKKQQK